MASVSAFLLTLLMAPVVIRWLTALKVGEQVRSADEMRGLADYSRSKNGIPTMGGCLILFSLVGSVFLWGDLSNAQLILAALVTAVFGAIGFSDDFLKLKNRQSKGLAARAKFLLQVGAGLAFILLVLRDPFYPATIEVPFLKEPAWNLGFWMIPFVVLVLVGASNAVNLADGLDGLAVGCTTMIALTLTVMSYLTGHHEMARYLLIPYIPGAGELTVFCAALVGACLGFLWYNSPPANVFMGDTGSLALGGAIGAVAVLIKKEILLALIGGIFVAEALSVIFQVASFQLTGRRIFLMAPIHHHFQLKGWPESKVTIRFWIIGGVLALLSLSTLKLR